MRFSAVAQRCTGVDSMASLAPGKLLRSEPAGVDDAHDIGAQALRTAASAMRAGRDNGSLVYVGEVPVYVATVWRVVEDRAGVRHGWWRLEIKIEAKNNWIRPKDDFVIAQHPYSTGWLQTAPFKPGSKKGAMERPNFSNRAFATTDDLLERLDQLGHDFWEKGNYLTAAISRPSLGFSSADGFRNVQRQAVFVFGNCENFQRVEQDLFNTDCVRLLLKDTEMDTIRFWASKAKLGTKPRLFEEVKAEASMLMIMSIRQALAGPHKDSDQWIGRPVTDKVDQIYRGHLNRRNRVVARKQGKLAEYDDALNYAEGGEDLEDYGLAAAGRY